MNKPKILITDSLHPVFKTRFEEEGYLCDVRETISGEEIMSIIGDYEGLIVGSKILVTRELIDRGTKLQFIGRAGSGMEIIDHEYARQKGIVCINSPEGNCDAVAEHAIGMLLSLLNNVTIADNQMRNGQWLREPNRGTELGGKTFGIIGFGHTGQSLARKLSGFGVKILAYDKYKTGFGSESVDESDLESIFENADFLSLHLPLTGETQHFVNEEFITKFRKPFWFINTARGKNMDTIAVLSALESGKIKGAVLDVFENENPGNFSEKEKMIWSQMVVNQKVVLTPHIAGWTFESHERIARTLSEKLLTAVRNVKQLS